ncbi:MAG: aldo/keto reductase [Chloroflexi bacterium]|nr:aldo/keto reductase [Chloroflexota bacterium]
MHTETPITLGQTEIRTLPLGIGTWAWGDRFFWNYGRDYTAEDIKAAFQTAVEEGITFFDTAEVYGMGRAERFLNEMTADTQSPIVIATKFFPFPWRVRRAAMRRALRQSLKRLGRSQVDLYQIHFPWPPRSTDFWVSTLGDLVQEGLVKAAGVSNYNAEQMRRAHAILQAKGIPLASNQVHYSLLHRDPEKNGVLHACQELGITLIAYSPLEMGLLTGKYSPENPPGGVRNRRYSREYLARILPLIGLMREIGQGHGGKTPAQVALNWVICKGALPIPGAKNARQAQSNAGALGWRLTDDEVAALDQASEGL